MLTRTFCHIPGIGSDTEQELWRQGCLSWADYLANPTEFKVGSASRKIVTEYVQRSMEALEAGHHQFFAKALRSYDVWRAWPEFQERCLYLDIETDGGPTGDAITLIGFYDGQRFTCRIRGNDIENFRDDVSNCSMIVTFFGSGFDLPMLRKRFPGLHLDQIHLDLCPTLRNLGLRGGLKAIERQLGLKRSDQTQFLTGRDAVELWLRYQRYGDTKALNVLLTYNQEDVVNLEKLARYAYRRLCRECGPALNGSTSLLDDVVEEDRVSRSLFE